MLLIFQSDLKNGYFDVLEQEEALFIRTGFRREASGVALELPAVETADLAEALLRHLDETTRQSVISSVVGESNVASPVHSEDGGTEDTESELCVSTA